MGKIAFVFAGQGAQYSGMGKSLYEFSPKAKEIFDYADKVRTGTINQCFNGSDEELKQTVNTQPCLYLVDLCCALALNEQGIYADCAAGFSLGEIAAAAYSGLFTYQNGFDIVTQRGLYMDKASKAYDTGMTAVLKINPDDVEKLCTDFDNVYPVNYNSDGQTVVSGIKSELEEFKVRALEAGARCVDLAVSGAFHSPFMNEAEQLFFNYLKDLKFNKPNVKLYSNYTSQPYGDDAHNTLSKQITNPVRWKQIVENMIADGVDVFIEVGAGKTLSTLIKRISKQVKVYSVQDKETLLKTVLEVNAYA